MLESLQGAYASLIIPIVLDQCLPYRPCRQSSKGNCAIQVGYADYQMDRGGLGFDPDQGHS